MTPVEVTAIVVGFMLLSLWLVRHLLISKALRKQILVRPDPSAELPDNPPVVTILVAAKDEEENIGDCIDSLLELDYPQLEFIVIDDRSSDRTADIVRQRAATDSRLRLVQVSHLAEGWFGKPHAMQTGAAEATGQWLLFVDADCRLSPGSVRAVMRHALDQQGDMLSLWPSLTLRSFAEKLLMPTCGSLLAVYHRPDRVNNPDSPAAFANGQFILIRSEAFQQVGGFEQVRNVLVEDIAFARHVKHSGFRAITAVSQNIFSVRMYSTFSQVWRGWSRIFSGSFSSLPNYLVALLLVLLVSFGPYWFTVSSGLLARGQQWQSPLWNMLFALGLVQITVMLTVLARFHRMANSPPLYVLLHPLALLLMFSTLIKGLFIRLGWSRVKWRGNTYQGASNITTPPTDTQ